MITRYKPTSPGRRDMTRAKSSGVKPSKKLRKTLLVSIKKQVGRSKGKISMNHQSNGVKKAYRLIDFKRDKYGINGIVESIQYDPYRSCDIALVLYKDGERRFILAPENLNVGDSVVSGKDVEIKAGNALPMGEIPLGTAVHNLEMYPGAGGKFIRSAGLAGFITAKEGAYVNIKMPSGEIRKFPTVCYATIGKLGNEDLKLEKVGKAGRLRKRGIRPTTRAKTKPDSHPLAGSYKRRLGRHPVDEWGNKSKGKKTRKRKHTNQYIVKDRRG
jgi:large subunit ribosomal protein L2